jgi:hypothetical protein
MTGRDVQGIGRPGAAPHWREGDHFRAQCGNPAARAVVERRWTMFARAIDNWREGRPDTRPLRCLL